MIAARFFLRRHRRTILGAVVAVIVVGAVQVSGYVAVAGHTEAQRLAFGKQTEALARQIAFLTPVPTELGTLGGYLGWRVFGALPFFLGLWAVWLAVSMLRGSEDANIAESLVAAGAKRSTLVRAATGAFALAAAASGIGMWLSLLATSSGELGERQLTLQAIALVAVLLFVFGLGTVVAQIGASRRSAFAIGAAALFALNLVNSLGSVSEPLRSIRWASPLAWYSTSDPLARGGTFSIGGTAGLVALAAALIALSTLAFGRRDLGQPLLAPRRRRRPEAEPRGAGWYGHPVLGALYERRVGLGWWVAGVLAEVVFFVSLAPSLVQAIDQVPQLHAYLERITKGDVTAGLISLFLIGTVQLLLALFAIAAVAGWARDDASGRLELDLSLPLARSGVVRRRAAALIASSAGIAVIALGFMFVLAASRGSSSRRGACCSPPCSSSRSRPRSRRWAPSGRRGGRRAQCSFSPPSPSSAISFRKSHRSTAGRSGCSTSRSSTCTATRWSMILRPGGSRCSSPSAWWDSSERRACRGPGTSRGSRPTCALPPRRGTLRHRQGDGIGGDHTIGGFLADGRGREDRQDRGCDPDRQRRSERQLDLGRLA
jgi:hypothetical protein